jgi:hypothetical protein
MKNITALRWLQQEIEEFSTSDIKVELDFNLFEQIIDAAIELEKNQMEQMYYEGFINVNNPETFEETYERIYK